MYAYGFYAYDPSFRNGVRVVAADLDGNGAAEVVTGTGPGGGPAVAIFEGNGVYVDGFLAGPADARGGVTVKVTTDSNGKASISAVPGPNRTAPATTTTTGAPVTAQPFPSARPSGLLPADGVFPS